MELTKVIPNTATTPTRYIAVSMVIISGTAGNCSIGLPTMISSTAIFSGEVSLAVAEWNMLAKNDGLLMLGVAIKVTM
jgi:hypothetical protein